MRHCANGLRGFGRKSGQLAAEIDLSFNTETGELNHVIDRFAKDLSFIEEDLAILRRVAEEQDAAPTNPENDGPGGPDREGRRAKGRQGSATRPRRLGKGNRGVQEVHRSALNVTRLRIAHAVKELNKAIDRAAGWLP